MNSPKHLATFTLLLLLGGPARAAEFRPVPPDALDRLNSSTSSLLAAERATLQSRLAEALVLDPDSSLELTSERDLSLSLGRSLAFQQTFNDVPIWGADVTLLQDLEGSFLALSGRALYDLPSLALLSREAPGWTREQALAKARELTSSDSQGRTSYHDENVTLVYHLLEDGSLALSYHTTFYAILADTADGLRHTRPVYIIDASTGDVLDSYENLQQAQVAHGPGGNHRTGQYAWGSDILPHLDVKVIGSDCAMHTGDVATENANNRASGETGAPWTFPCKHNSFKATNSAFSPLNDAHGFAQIVVDMFRDWYGVVPYSKGLHLKVHYGRNNYMSHWTGTHMTFGDGDRRYYPPVSLDAVAHEAAHAFTSEHSELQYRHQSGAINEAFSDMVGEAAEYYAEQRGIVPFQRPMPDFLHGADYVKQPGAAVRYMCSPRRPSIGHFKEYHDNLNVHYSSGIYNKAFCLIASAQDWDVRKAFNLFFLANQSGLWNSRETLRGGALDVLRIARQLNYSDTDVVEAFRAVGIDVNPRSVGAAADSSGSGWAELERLSLGIELGSGPSALR